MPASSARPLRELLQDAIAALGAGDSATALRHAEAAVEQAPDVAVAWLVLGRARLAGAQVAAAVPALREAARLQPDSAETWATLGAALQALGQTEAPFRCYETALRLAPTSPAILSRVGTFLLERGAVADAEACFQAACADGRTEGAPGLLRVLEMRGDVDGAVALIDRYPGLLGVSPGFTISAARALLRSGQAARALAALDALDALPVAQNKPTVVAVEHARGDVLDAMGEPLAAFDARSRAHAARGLVWDAAAHTARVDDLCRDWPRARLSLDCQTAPEAPARPGSDRGADAVFIVGMPRSGTTLLEQILASHPAVRTCGELDDLPAIARDLPDDASSEVVDAAAARYLGRLRRDGNATFILDKLPANSLYLHAAARLLPGARVIALSRDALDTCVSCYSKDFAATLGWTTDLYALGRYYADHERVMSHWRKELPLPLYDVRYEALVSDPETEVRRVLAFLGLPYHAKCLRFFERAEQAHTASYAQVRRPINRDAIGRAVGVADRLGPLLQGLKAKK